jgi:hypothetical protein
MRQTFGKLILLTSWVRPNQVIGLVTLAYCGMMVLHVTQHSCSANSIQRNFTLPLITQFGLQRIATHQWCMNKAKVEYTQWNINLPWKNRILSLMMNLEDLMLSEISYVQKDKHMLSLMCGIQLIWTHRGTEQNGDCQRHGCLREREKWGDVAQMIYN